MSRTRYPLLYQINTRVWLTELSRRLGRRCNPGRHSGRRAGPPGRAGLRLGLVPERLANRPGGAAGLAQQPRVAARIRGDAARLARGGHRRFRVRDHRLHGPSGLGGDAALGRLRERLRKRGLRLMLDFVPNHTGLDHPWVDDHPEYYIPRHRARSGPRCAELHLDQTAQRRPATGVRTRSVFSRLARHASAQLRQPGHAGSDDRRAAEDRRAMRRRALRHGHAGPAGRLRADLGHLGRNPSGRRRPSGCASESRASASWPRSTGTWNGRCSNRASTTPTTSGSTTACATSMPGRCASISTPGSDYQNKLARFLENHDEPRAAATFPPGIHEAAAVITFLSPGLRFFHQGQFEGRKKRISPHLCRGPGRASRSSACAVLRPAARRRCARPALRDGKWQLLECAPAWDGNWTYDCFVAFAWQGAGRRPLGRGGELRPQPEPVPPAVAV